MKSNEEQETIQDLFEPTWKLFEETESLLAQSSNTNTVISPEEQSHQFSLLNELDYDKQLLDGFRVTYEDDNEIVVIYAEQPKLKVLVANMLSFLKIFRTFEKRALGLAKLCEQRLGGGSIVPENVERYKQYVKSIQQQMQQTQQPQQAQKTIISLGNLIEIAGLDRHIALLYKYLADRTLELYDDGNGNKIDISVKARLTKRWISDKICTRVSVRFEDSDADWQVDFGNMSSNQPPRLLKEKNFNTLHSKNFENLEYFVHAASYPSLGFMGLDKFTNLSDTKFEKYGSELPRGLSQTDAELLRQKLQPMCDDSVTIAREKFCASLGVLDPYMIVAKRIDAPSFYIVHRSNGNIAMITSGLWDPNEKAQIESLTSGGPQSEVSQSDSSLPCIELLAEAKESELGDMSSSWLYQCLLEVACTAKRNGTKLRRLLRERSYSTMEVMDVKLPFEYLDPTTGRACMLLGIESPTVPKYFMAPNKVSVQIVTARLLTVAQWRDSQESNVGKKSLAARFNRDGTHHVSSLLPPGPINIASPTTTAISTSNHEWLTSEFFAENALKSGPPKSTTSDSESNKEKKPVEYFSKFIEEMVSILDLKIPTPIAGTLIVSEANETFSDILIKKFSGAIVGYESATKQFKIKIRFLKTKCDLKQHTLFSTGFDEISFSRKECKTLLLSNLEHCKTEKEAEGILLDFLQETMDAKNQLKNLKEVADKKKQALLKKQCENIYMEFGMISGYFLKISGSDLKTLLKANTEKYNTILDLIESNKKPLQDQEAGIGVTKKNAQRQAKGALVNNEEKRKKATKYFNDFLELCQGAKGEKGEKDAKEVLGQTLTTQTPKDGFAGTREFFRRDYEKAAKDIVRLLKEGDLAGMEALMAPLKSHQTTCEKLLKQLNEQLESMDFMIAALEEQREKLGIEKHRTEARQRSEAEERLYQARVAQQAAILQVIEDDINKQRALEEQQRLTRERSLQRERWIAKRNEIQRLKQEQRQHQKHQNPLLSPGPVKQNKKDSKELESELLESELIDKAKDAKDAKNTKDVKEQRKDKSKDTIMAKRRQPKTLTLAQQLNPLLQREEARYTTRGYLSSFKKMLEEEITLESDLELEGYALLGKLAQFLEAMQRQGDKAGILAREVRNTLYHADPQVVSIKGKVGEIAHLVDMILELLAINWNDVEAVEKAILPAHFVKLALYPRKHGKSEDALKHFTVLSLVEFIQKSDAEKHQKPEKPEKPEKEKEKVEKGDKNRKIQLPSEKICEERYRFYAIKLSQINKRSMGYKPNLVVHAVGYLEGVMGGYAMDAVQQTGYKGFLKEREYRDIIERGRAFRHNRLDLSKLAEEFEDISLVESSIKTNISSINSISSSINNNHIHNEINTKTNAEQPASAVMLFSEATAYASATSTSTPTPTPTPTSAISIDSVIKTTTAASIPDKLSKPKVVLECPNENCVFLKFGENKAAAEQFLEAQKKLANDIDVRIFKAQQEYMVSYSLGRTEFFAKGNRIPLYLIELNDNPTTRLALIS